MSSVPALCNICCLCVKHRLLESRIPSVDREDEKAAGERRGGSEDIMMHGTNSKAQLADIPTTLTQVYLSVVSTFLSCDTKEGKEIDKAKATGFPQR